MKKLFLAAIGVIGLMSVAASSWAAELTGLGNLSGKVSQAKDVGQLTVYALNTDKNVGYQVYVVNGAYRATNMFPGNYEVTLRGAVGQKSWGVTPQMTKTKVESGKSATLDLVLKDTNVKPVYAGGLTYEGWTDIPFDEDKPVAVPVAYDKLYPPGRPRELIEGICMGCHTVSFLPYGVPRTHPDGRPVHDKDGWAITVDRMVARKTYMDGKPLTLSREDRAALIDYLNTNFGIDAVPRAVLQEHDPVLDPAALAKAEMIEYRLPNSKEFSKRSTHHTTFNPDGTMWTLDRGSNGPGRGLIWINPETAEMEFYPDNGMGEPVIAEWLSADIDGSVWYGGLRHFNKQTGKYDVYKQTGPVGGAPLGVSTGIFDTHGDMWLTGAGISRWNRRTDTFTRWEIPAYRAGSYGLSLDSADRVWIAEAGTDGGGVFDPRTEKYTHFKMIKDEKLAMQIRRVGVDTQDNGWAASWASTGMMNSKLFRANPETHKVDEWKIPIEYTNPYDTAGDPFGDVWIATDNHVVKFDTKAEKFILYPTTTRTDIPRLLINKEGAIYFEPRNGGQSGGYGAAVTVLYPDKDKITTLKAIADPKGPFSRHFNCKDCKPVLPDGKVKYVDLSTPKNYGEYDKVLVQMGLPPRANPKAGVKTGVEGIQ